MRVLPALEDMTVPYISSLKIPGVPSKKSEQLRMLEALIAQHTGFDDRFYTAQGELIGCLIEKLQKKIEKLRYNILHHSFLIKKIAGNIYKQYSSLCSCVCQIILFKLEEVQENNLIMMVL